MLTSLVTRNFSKKIKKIGVVGAGQMGTGIAIVGAKVAGLEVKCVDLNESALENSNKFVKNWLEKEEGKGRLTADEKYDVLNKMSFSTRLEELDQTDFVVEAIIENFDIKKSIFEKLDKIVPEDAILASNTSSLSITKLASTVPERADKFIGMHFMNPVPVMKLVEVIKGLQTSPETLQTVLDMAKSMNKITSTARDIPGFIANRILIPYINEAVFALYEGIGTVEDIDITMKYGTNVPMGPLTLADFIGLDTVLYIQQILHTELGDSKYRPCPLLVNYVQAGYLGRKSGKGFYDYTKK
ncbi:unnamed protein product [Moneuplotes crassus]|uniref:3-hydroxybutyryl-CoA dehydrogenase n=1 Tax=Euplotes crassus TaxID=5936 RepID=A0AAD1XBI6_EUPCR|nr:unnamed protein product [Moneuplotes crassus]